MDMTGERQLVLPRQRVWDALNDPAVLQQCIPGCETVEKTGEHEFRMAMTAAIGPVKAKFTGKIRLSHVVPPESYTIAFEGSGGVAGFGKGSAKVALAEHEGGTRMTWQAHATVGGKLAQVGSRLVDGVARKMADDFFARFAEVVAPAAGGAKPVEPATPAARVPWWVWVVAGVLGALVFLALR
jgi:carbon monoxide dehydrogenase subunit G